jgi:cytoskeletal protein RodZ
MKPIKTDGEALIMNGRKRIKRTTLLIIGVVLLWGAVAIWNEVQKNESGLTSPRSTSASYPSPSQKSHQTSMNSVTNGYKMSSP